MFDTADWQAATASCITRIMADIWSERAPKGLSEDLDAWRAWLKRMRLSLTSLFVAACNVRFSQLFGSGSSYIFLGFWLDNHLLRARCCTSQDLCVGIVNSVTRSNREVKGLCSSVCMCWHLRDLFHPRLTFGSSKFEAATS